MELELSEFSLNELLTTAMTLLREQAVRRGIRLELAVDPAVGTIVADQRKVKQIVLNLVANAVKFTPDGGRVDVSARQVDDAVEVSVRDNGIGIAPDDQARIFEEFARARSTAHEGTGLGLTLTQKFVALHGGRISLESALGEGSSFTFTLPRSGILASDPWRDSTMDEVTRSRR
jgi:signal transduction histidine kinase